MSFLTHNSSFFIPHWGSPVIPENIVVRQRPYDEPADAFFLEKK